MYYFDTPEYSVALNAKVGSSSLARAIIRRYCPTQEWLINTAVYPPGQSENTHQWHWMCPGRTTPNKPVVLLVRDPVDRFASACQQIGITDAEVDSVIQSLVDDVPVVRVKPSDVTAEEWSKKLASAQKLHDSREAAKVRHGGTAARFGHMRDNIHFLRQADCAQGKTILFRFPEHIAEAASLLGITGTLPDANRATRPKPALTPRQVAAVQSYYSDDIALFNRTQRAGTEYTPRR